MIKMKSSSSKRITLLSICVFAVGGEGNEKSKERERNYFDYEHDALFYTSLWQQQNPNREYMNYSFRRFLRNVVIAWQHSSL